MMLWCENFAPGFLDTPEPDALPAGATPDARNAWFRSIDATGVTGQRRALMGKRPGSRLLNPTVIAASQPVDLFEFRRSGASPELLALCNGSLYAFDDVNSFGAALASGWTAGNRGRCLVTRGNAYVFDGAYLRRYNGSAVLEVGSAAPSSITNMATAAGPGVTGTYVAVYTWYDAATDHHSSVSAETASLAPANQQRQHTKPGSAAPAWATHWGVWVRRTDTSELNFYHVANVAIGSATHTEAVSDTARVTPADAPSEGDPPPGAFALLEEWRGWGIGVLPGADDFYISRRGDLQSWHPRNKFGVAKGDGEDLACVRKFGSNLLLQKPHSTHRLVGDRVPFEIESVHTAYGNVSQEAGLEVDGKFYGWDRVRGPYVTDLVSWRPLADGRVATLASTINLASLSKIVAVHAERQNLILWAVPTSGSERTRTILAYHYLLDAWLPPIDGLEYRSLVQFTTSSGAIGVYTGDFWGRAYELFSGTADGPPSGDVLATVTSATPDTVTCSGAAFYTTGSGLVGMPVAVRDTAGNWQWRRIASNTATIITLDVANGSPWSTIPSSGDTLVVGGINWYWWVPWLDFSRPEVAKVLRYLFLGVQSPLSSVTLAVDLRVNGDEGLTALEAFNFPASASSGVWGSSLWGVALWGGAARTLRKAAIDRSPFSVQFRFSNPYANQELTVTAWGLSADALPRRQSPGPSAT